MANTLILLIISFQDGIDKSNSESINGAAKAIAEEMAEKIMTEQLVDNDSEKMVEREAEKKTETETETGDGGVGENGDQKNSRQQKVARYSNR